MTGIGGGRPAAGTANLFYPNLVIPACPMPDKWGLGRCFLAAESSLGCFINDGKSNGCNQNKFVLVDCLVEQDSSPYREESPQEGGRIRKR
jgi:hypothetical protein